MLPSPHTRAFRLAPHVDRRRTAYLSRMVGLLPASAANIVHRKPHTQMRNTHQQRTTTTTRFSNKYPRPPAVTPHVQATSPAAAIETSSHAQQSSAVYMSHPLHSHNSKRRKSQPHPRPSTSPSNSDQHVLPHQAKLGSLYVTTPTLATTPNAGKANRTARITSATTTCQPTQKSRCTQTTAIFKRTHTQMRFLQSLTARWLRHWV